MEPSARSLLIPHTIMWFFYKNSSNILCISLICFIIIVDVHRQPHVCVTGMFLYQLFVRGFNFHRSSGRSAVPPSHARVNCKSVIANDSR